MVRVAVEMIDESGHPADRSVVPVRTVDYRGRHRRCRRGRRTVLRFAPFPRSSALVQRFTRWRSGFGLAC